MALVFFFLSCVLCAFSIVCAISVERPAVKFLWVLGAVVYFIDAGLFGMLWGASR